MKKIIAFILALSVVLALPVTGTAAGKPKAPKITSIKSTATTVTVKWEKVKNAAGYGVYQKAGKGKYHKIALITNPKTHSYKVTKLSTKTEYRYFIKSFKVAGKKRIYSNHKKSVKVYTKINTPTIKSVSAPNSTSLKITWKKIDNADGYRVYKKVGKSFKKVKTLGAKTTKYTFKKLAKNKTYTVRVKAFYNKGKEKIFGKSSDRNGVTNTKENRVYTEQNGGSMYISGKNLYFVTRTKPYTDGSKVYVGLYVYNYKTKKKKKLFTLNEAPGHLIVSDKYVFFTTMGTNSNWKLWRCDKSGANRTIILTSAENQTFYNIYYYNKKVYINVYDTNLKTDSVYAVTSTTGKVKKPLSLCYDASSSNYVGSINEWCVKKSENLYYAVAHNNEFVLYCKSLVTGETKVKKRGVYESGKQFNWNTFSKENDKYLRKVGKWEYVVKSDGLYRKKGALLQLVCEKHDDYFVGTSFVAGYDVNASDNGKASKVTVYSLNGGNEKVIFNPKDGMTTTPSSGSTSTSSSGSYSGGSSYVSQRQICSVCHGSGWDNCMVCHGTGRVLRYSMGQSYYGVCTYSRCRGGRVDCIVCGGDGWIYD